MKRFIAVYILIGFSCISYAEFPTMHPLHVSYTNIEIRNGGQTSTIVFKCFADDFSLLFYHLFEKEIKPLAGVEFTPKELELVNSYFSAAFSLQTEGGKLALIYEKKEQNEESVWLYYRCTLPKKTVKSLLLTNKLFLDLYEDQTNLVIVNQGKSEKGYTFNYRNMEEEIERSKE